MSCERCGGFKVYDYFYGASPCDGFRCINCGAITNLRMIMPARPEERTIKKSVRPKVRPAPAALPPTSTLPTGEVQR
jgi:hypothetical protein